VCSWEKEAQEQGAGWGKSKRGMISKPGAARKKGHFVGGGGGGGVKMFFLQGGGQKKKASQRGDLAELNGGGARASPFTSHLGKFQRKK